MKIPFIHLVGFIFSMPAHAQMQEFLFCGYQAPSYGQQNNSLLTSGINPALMGYAIKPSVEIATEVRYGMRQLTTCRAVCAYPLVKSVLGVHLNRMGDQLFSVTSVGCQYATSLSSDTKMGLSFQFDATKFKGYKSDQIISGSLGVNSRFTDQVRWGAAIRCMPDRRTSGFDKKSFLLGYHLGLGAQFTSQLSASLLIEKMSTESLHSLLNFQVRAHQRVQLGALFSLTHEELWCQATFRTPHGTLGFSCGIHNTLGLSPGLLVATK